MMLRNGISFILDIRVIPLVFGFFYSASETGLAPDLQPGGLNFFCPDTIFVSEESD